MKNITVPALGNKSTFSTDLERVAKRIFKGKFHGVYPSDFIPKLTTKKPYAILNLDKSYELGSHWVGIALLSGKEYLLYDSFGRKSTKILPSHKFVNTELDAEQTKKEENCGARTMAWLIVFDRFGEGYAKQI